MATNITLRAGHATPANIVLRAVVVAASVASTIYLYGGHATPANIILRAFGTDLGGGGFPTQFFGLKAYYQGAVQNLCLVAEADAPAGMGGVIKIDKNGTLYAVYLVETTDPNASPVYVRTTTGTKAIREKT